MNPDILTSRAVADWICLGPWSMTVAQLTLTIDALETYLRVSQKALSEAQEKWNHSRLSSARDDILRHEEIIAKANEALSILRDCLAEQS
jgi:hypothetical protein